jgi:Tol biopolymer transport system component
MLLRGHRQAFRQRRREGNVVIESTTRVTVTDIFAMNADGSGLGRVTDTPRLAESPVSWDPSGEPIAYAAEHVGAEDLLPLGDIIVEANADGSCPTEVLSDFEFAYIGPAWQPGPGRGAGRIPC